MPERKWLKIGDITEEYGVTGTSIRTWINDGVGGKKLKAKRPGGAGMYLIHRDDLEEFLESVHEIGDAKQ